MKVHHLNCGTACPIGGRLFDGRSRGALARLVCHCLLIETDASGLVLIDTGFGAKDVANPERLPTLFRNTNNIQLRPEETAIAQVRALGHRPEDVRHIILSHLDFDHAGGIEDFPAATVHVMAAERRAAERKDGGATGSLRYDRAQWDGVSIWAEYEGPRGENWYGFSAVRQLEGLPPEILMIPLMGHTWGHAGVAIDTGPGGWLFYAADAYFYRGEVLTPPRRVPMASGYQQLMEVDRRSRLLNQSLLRRLQHERGGEVRLFCAHDATEFDLLRGQSDPN